MGSLFYMKPKLTSNVIIRIDDDLKAKLAKIQSETGCSVSEVIRQSLASFVEYYEKNKCIVLPIVVVPLKELETTKHLPPNKR